MMLGWKQPGEKEFLMVKKEIGAAHPPHPQSGIQGARGTGGAARR
jgi:hypothetical protein